MANKKPFRVRDRETKQVLDIYFPGQDVNVNTDGTFKSLPDALDQLQEEIGEAGTGNYTIPPGGIPYSDLSQGVRDTLDEVANKVTQEAGKGLSTNDYTTEEKTKLAGLNNYNDAELRQQLTRLQTALDNLMNGESVTDAIDTFAEVTAFLNGINTDDETLAAQLLALDTAIKSVQQSLLDKANTADVARDYATKGELSGKLSQSDVSVETQGDGTVDINVKDDTYSINLNHTHKNMAKLVVCEESDLPSTLDNSTIYAITDSGETEIEKLIIRGMEFAGGGYAPGTPAITSPGSTVNLGANDGSGVTGSIRVKGNSYITGALTVTVASNSGLSLTYGQQTGSQVTIAQADAITGVQVDVTYSGSGALELADGLVVSGGGASPKSVVVVVVPPRPIELTAIKTTGTQYFDLGYTPNPNTKFEFDVKFEKNSITDSSRAANNCCPFLSAPEASGKYFIFQTGYGNSELYSLMAYTNTTNPFSKSLYGNEATFCQRGTIEYENGSLAFLGKTQTPATMSHTAGGTLLLGYGTNKSKIFDVFNMYVYGLKIYEGSTLLHDFKPVTYQGTPGLYDEVNDTFISSESGTDPIAVE